VGLVKREEFEGCFLIAQDSFERNQKSICISLMVREIIPFALLFHIVVIAGLLDWGL
jgi:hypothetical protein